MKMKKSWKIKIYLYKKYNKLVVQKFWRPSSQYCALGFQNKNVDDSRMVFTIEYAEAATVSTKHRRISDFFDIVVIFEEL